MGNLFDQSILDKTYEYAFELLLTHLVVNCVQFGRQGCYMSGSGHGHKHALSMEIVQPPCNQTLDVKSIGRCHNCCLSLVFLIYPPRQHCQQVISLVWQGYLTREHLQL